MWFIGVEVEQETSAPPPKKNPGSAPEPLSTLCDTAYKNIHLKALTGNPRGSLK